LRMRWILQKKSLIRLLCVLPILWGNRGGIAYNEEELKEIASNGLRLSRVHQVLIEKCIAGWKEIEYEVCATARVM